MSQDFHTKSPLNQPALSSSPRPSPLSRPQWPWSSYSQRPPSVASFSGSSSSNLNVSNLQLPIAEGSSKSPTPLSAIRRTGRGDSVSYPMYHDETTREWSFIAFEWIIKDVSSLRTAIEGNIPFDLRDYELLRDSPIIGDGKYKVEVVLKPQQTQDHPRMDEPDPDSPPTTPGSDLNLYITSLMMDYARPDFEISGHIMAAVKAYDGSAMERGSKVVWLWEHWEKDFVFRRDSEVWHCAFPTLADLLENPGVATCDAFILCLQIHSPVGPVFPHHPLARYVPRELLQGLEASLDNPNTGDVRFVCLERGVGSPPSPDASTASRGSGVSHSLSGSFSYRKRIIWAHRDILVRRSEYFATMLDSSFVEASASANERQVYTVNVEEADFLTIYWLLKWVYGNWLLLDSNQDPKVAMEGIPENWQNRWPIGRPQEWSWKILVDGEFKEEDEASFRDDESSSVGSTASHISERRMPSGSDRKGKLPYTPTSVVFRGRNASGSRLPISPQSLHPVGEGASKIDTGSKAVVASSSSRSGTASFPVSPHQSRPPRFNAKDPHHHPTAPPDPALPLSIYRISHRYQLPALQELALEHLITGLTAENSFPLLLASYLWEELRVLIEDFIVHHWEAVSTSETFSTCCQEVSVGEWGVEGGKTLVALFRRLQSPAR